jgi:polyvinyl alcohol dehydrogenase (cytochrome)
MQKAFNRKGAQRASQLRWRNPATVAAVALMAGVVAAAPAMAQSAGDWPMGGQNLHNTRSALGEHAIGLSNVGQLAPRWSVETDGNVSATPTVAAGVVYVPDFGGSLWAVDAASGQVKWHKKVSDLSGIPNDASRTSPAYWKGTLVIGQGTQITDNPSGAYMLAVKADDGSPL